MQKFFQRVKGKIRFLWNTWTFRPYVIDKIISGEKFRFQISNLVGKIWYDYEHAWPELSWVATHLIRENDSVIDCGAHHGLSTLLFSRKVGPHGRVIAIEANPQNATVIRRNLDLNGIENTEVINAAAADKIGQLTIATHSNSSIVAAAQSHLGHVITVPALTLDSIVNSAFPSFLKVDVEGAELLVLRGAQKILAHRPNIDLELHCEFYKDPAAILSGIFDLIEPLSLQWHIQRKVDGVIEPFTLNLPNLFELQRFPNVHLFGHRLTI